MSRSYQACIWIMEILFIRRLNGQQRCFYKWFGMARKVQCNSESIRQKVLFKLTFILERDGWNYIGIYGAKLRIRQGSLYIVSPLHYKRNTVHIHQLICTIHMLNETKLSCYDTSCNLDFSNPIHKAQRRHLHHDKDFVPKQLQRISYKR